MKRAYETPMACAEEFMPNEYVAVCWGVSCSVNDANSVERGWPIKVNGRWTNNYAAGQTHQSDHCGTQTNQWVIDDNNDGTVDRMIETGTDGLGNLSCTLYTDATYTTKGSFSGVTTGSYIYWTTTAGDRTWHHQGSVIGTDSSHPNRS